MSFDRVASIYDATRALPPGVDDLVADRVVAATGAGSDTRFLELGIGTGRIALPFIRRGYPYTGIDVSQDMVERLRVKAPNAPNLTLIEGDVTDLPLADASVDVVLVVHVLHLVPEWRTALDEAERVLEPEGFFIEGHNNGLPDQSGDEIRRRWRSYMEEEGVELRPRYGLWEEIAEEMIGRGHQASVYRVATWHQTFVPLELIEGFRNREYSETWPMSDDALLAVHEKMLRWSAERFEDPSKPVVTPSEFVLNVYRV